VTGASVAIANPTYENTKARPLAVVMREQAYGPANQREAVQ